MIKEGTITKTCNSNAWVQVGRNSMCDHCESKSECTTLSSSRKMEAEAKNLTGGKVGDRVQLKVNNISFLKIALMFYITPVIALITGALIGVKIAPEFSLNPELSSIIFALLAFVASFTIIYIFGKHVKKNQKYMPVIVKIISRPC